LSLLYKKVLSHFCPSRKKKSNIENAHIFIVDASCLQIGAIVNNIMSETIEGNTPNNNYPNDEEPLNLPFGTLWVEFIKSGSFKYLSTDGRNNKKYHMHVKGFFVNELGPNNYLFSAFINTYDETNTYIVEEDTGLYYADTDTVKSNMVMYKICLDLTRTFLITLNQSVLGSEKTTFLIPKPGSNKKKIPIIKDIIRVVPKKEQYKTKPLFSKEIDWTHRWEVRGHWRKIKGIGKNRNNEYCTKSFTWVVPHEKGPENKILVKKKRIINDFIKTH